MKNKGVYDVVHINVVNEPKNRAEGPLNLSTYYVVRRRRLIIAGISLPANAQLVGKRQLL